MGDDFTTVLSYFIDGRRTHTNLEEDEPPEGVTEHDDEEHVREIAAQEEQELSERDEVDRHLAGAVTPTPRLEDRVDHGQRTEHAGRDRHVLIVLVHVHAVGHLKGNLYHRG